MTDWHRERAELTAKVERYEAALRALRDAIWEYDRRFTYDNPTWDETEAVLGGLPETLAERAVRLGYDLDTMRRAVDTSPKAETPERCRESFRDTQCERILGHKGQHLCHPPYEQLGGTLQWLSPVRHTSPPPETKR